jgi:hypothetical protein
VNQYRVYKLDRSSRITSLPHVIQCEDDDAALVMAQQFIDGHALEIWAGNRRVALVPADLAVHR